MRKLSLGRPLRRPQNAYIDKRNHHKILLDKLQPHANVTWQMCFLEVKTCAVILDTTFAIVKHVAKCK